MSAGTEVRLPLLVQRTDGSPPVVVYCSPDLSLRDIALAYYATTHCAPPALDQLGLVFAGRVWRLGGEDAGRSALEVGITGGTRLTLLAPPAAAPPPAALAAPPEVALSTPHRPALTLDMDGAGAGADSAGDSVQPSALGLFDWRTFAAAAATAGRDDGSVTGLPLPGAGAMTASDNSLGLSLAPARARATQPAGSVMTLDETLAMLPPAVTGAPLGMAAPASAPRTTDRGDSADALAGEHVQGGARDEEPDYSDAAWLRTADALLNTTRSRLPFCSSLPPAARPPPACSFTVLDCNARATRITCPASSRAAHAAVAEALRMPPSCLLLVFHGCRVPSPTSHPDADFDIQTLCKMPDAGSLFHALFLPPSAAFLITPGGADGDSAVDDATHAASGVAGAASCAWPAGATALYGDAATGCMRAHCPVCGTLGAHMDARVGCRACPDFHEAVLCTSGLLPPDAIDGPLDAAAHASVTMASGLSLHEVARASYTWGDVCALRVKCLKCGIAGLARIDFVCHAALRSCDKDSQLTACNVWSECAVDSANLLATGHMPTDGSPASAAIRTLPTYSMCASRATGSVFPPTVRQQLRMLPAAVQPLIAACLLTGTPWRGGNATSVDELSRSAAPVGTQV